MMKYLLQICGVVCFMYLSASSSAETHVLLTIDVESFKAGNPETDIWGRLRGYDGEYGVPLILDLLRDNKAKATFYLNVYEIAKHGEGEIKRVAQQIVSRGQDLQLHTHPKPMYGKAGMSLFSYKEQVEILKKGKELIFQWTGKQVISHRAGAYLGDSTTLRALKEVGMFVDSSLSPASFSPLFKEGHKGNDIVEIKGILELPVTYFTQLKFMGWESKRFLDIESSSLRELKATLDDMAEEGSCAANIMMHSFSVTRYGYPDDRIRKKLDELLKYIKLHPKLVATDTENFFKAYKEKNLTCNPRSNFVPHSGVVNTYLRSWERFNDGWKNKVAALSVPGFLVLLAIFTVQLNRHIRHRSGRI